MAQPPVRRKTRSSLADVGQPAYATVLTPAGIREIGRVQRGDKIWTGTSWAKIADKVEQGTLPVKALYSTCGFTYGTWDQEIHGKHEDYEDAGIVCMGHAVQARAACMNPEEVPRLDEPLATDVMDGLVLGDGKRYVDSGDAPPGLLIDATGGKTSEEPDGDRDYWVSLVKHLIHRQLPRHKRFAVDSGIRAGELPNERNRRIPDRFRFASLSRVRGVLLGLFSANGNVDNHARKVDYSCASLLVVLQIAEMLSALGLRATWSPQNELPNPFDKKFIVQIRSALGISRFRSLIGFLQGYKRQHLDEILEGHTGGIGDLFSVMDPGSAPLCPASVYRIIVDDDAHTYWSGGILVSDCTT